MNGDSVLALEIVRGWVWVDWYTFWNKILRHCSHQLSHISISFLHLPVFFCFFNMPLRHPKAFWKSSFKVNRFKKITLFFPRSSNIKLFFCFFLISRVLLAGWSMIYVRQRRCRFNCTHCVMPLWMQTCCLKAKRAYLNCTRISPALKRCNV